jgi:hypothetical protein
MDLDRPPLRNSANHLGKEPCHVHHKVTFGMCLDPWLISSFYFHLFSSIFMFCSFSKAVPPNSQSGQSPLLSPPGPDGPGVLRVEQGDGDQLRFFVGEVEHLCWSDSNHVETR